MFATTRPLRFGDCDPSGIAYFPSYLNILVGVLEDFFADLGLPIRQMIDERKISWPTVRLDLTFVSPGYHGDQLDFTLRVRAIGRSSLDLDHEIRVGDRLLWSAKHRVVATSTETHTSIAWPEDIRAALRQHLEANDAHNPAT
ncbi:MAG: 4-hydroxybenzoyl-CoA thioesterase [Rhizobium sp. 63-7]|nr:MAG: 4-hydroxybenzoyl-CoA thioesterase [Rhizobium sp. 63-7]